MKNITYFLAIGALALGFAQPGHAKGVEHTESQNIKQQISQTIQQSIKKQVDLGFIVQKAHVSINIMSDEEMLLLKDDEKKPNPTLTNFKQSQASNNAAFINNQCHVNIIYNNKGDIPFMGHSNILKDVTKMQNDIQKTIAQKFIALHEMHHCEFSHINNPIIAFGKDTKFNE